MPNDGQCVSNSLLTVDSDLLSFWESVPVSIATCNAVWSCTQASGTALMDTEPQSLP